MVFVHEEANVWDLSHAKLLRWARTAGSGSSPVICVYEEVVGKVSWRCHVPYPNGMDSHFLAGAEEGARQSPTKSLHTKNLCPNSHAIRFSPILDLLCYPRNRGNR